MTLRLSWRSGPLRTNDAWFPPFWFRNATYRTAIPPARRRHLRKNTTRYELLAASSCVTDFFPRRLDQTKSACDALCYRILMMETTRITAKNPMSCLCLSEVKSAVVYDMKMKCRLVWSERWSERANDRPQVAQVNGRTPVCLRWWRVSSSDLAKLHLQLDHVQT